MSIPKEIPMTTLAHIVTATRDQGLADGGTVASRHAAGTLTDAHLLAAVRAVAGIEA